MRVTIIKDDNTAIVDGVGRTVDCSKLPGGFHALQWDGNGGEVEYVASRCSHCGARTKKGNETISDLSPYQTYVDAWKEANERAIREEAAARAEAERQAKETEAALAAMKKDRPDAA